MPALIALCRDHESLNLQQFEGLMALTNLASLDNVKSRIVAEKGISCFQYLQVQQYVLCAGQAGLVFGLVFGVAIHAHQQSCSLLAALLRKLSSARKYFDRIKGLRLSLGLPSCVVVSASLLCTKKPCAKPGTIVEQRS